VGVDVDVDVDGLDWSMRMSNRSSSERVSVYQPIEPVRAR
jgi:hypothetical protein